ncbi:FimD/PapC N-terminal domain-containing protein [Klebsiella grimontii]|uniref:FimD/PapC N-terminal domain-containing protein n=1 Tax=Klebsiella grimontii TaxID=2058152 RepID=UPI003F6558E7
MRNLIYSDLTPKGLSLLIKRALYSVCMVFSLSTSIYAIEFNTDMIDAEDRENVDLSQFEKKGYIPVGTYLVRVKINKNTLPRAYNLEWIKSDNENGSLLCLTQEHLRKVRISRSFLPKLTR